LIFIGRLLKICSPRAIDAFARLTALGGAAGRPGAGGGGLPRFSQAPVWHGLPHRETQCAETMWRKNGEILLHEKFLRVFWRILQKEGDKKTGPQAGFFASRDLLNRGRRQKSPAN
jgi:hypothetical protein